MKISFFIQSDKDPAPIYCRFSNGRQFDLRAKTDLVIHPGNWELINPDKQNPEAILHRPGRVKSNRRVKATKDSCDQVDLELSKYETDLKLAYNGSRNKLQFTNEWLAAFFHPHKRAEEAEIPSGLVAYFDYYGRAMAWRLRKASLVKLGVIKSLLERMERDLQARFMVWDVDERFRIRYEDYCHRERYSQNTIARNFRFIKTIVYHAERNGLEVSKQLGSISFKNVESEKIYLSPEDLAKIEKTEFTDEHLDNAKDWLLISCETGQRVSDFLRFTKDMIRIENGKHLLEFTQKKTGHRMTIPLSSKVRAILNKRNGQFPRKMSDQRYNEHIKKVAEWAGLDYPVLGSVQDESGRKVPGTYPKYKLVTSHIGRRSFATNNYGRIPTSLLISATGHKSEQQFLVYIGKSSSQQAIALSDYID